MTQKDIFVSVPATTLPNGTAVPGFRVGKYLASQSADNSPQINASGMPWTNITYHDARRVCEGAGYHLLTELQALAIAHDIANQDINWTGGKVGEGAVFMGLHEGILSGSKPGDFESPNPDERRWHQLSNGELIYDFAGNAYSWIFDDVQGDKNGIVATPFAKDTPSLTTILHNDHSPYHRSRAQDYWSMRQGMGWYPKAGDDWFGLAIIRGGFWGSGLHTGVFHLNGMLPECGDKIAGFRCTMDLPR